MMTGEDIVRAAREWVGTPFKHQGRVKGKAVDCIGLVAGIARELELLPVDLIDSLEKQNNGYAREPAHGVLERVIRSVFEPAVNGAQDGDILLMKFITEPQHVAVYSKTDNRIIHAYEAVGKCVEHRLDDKWKRRIVSVHRFGGVNVV